MLTYSRYFLILVLFAAAAIFSFIEQRQALTEAAIKEKEAFAVLTAWTIKDRFDNLSQLGQSLAVDIEFRNLTIEGKWDEAIESTKNIPKEFPYIERIFISDRDGILMADTPALPNVRGVNFSYRDWYQGAKNKEGPYISEVYRRAAKPQYNVIAVSVPIYNGTASGTLSGILVLQVKLNTLLPWFSDIQAGQNSFIYLIDQNGHLAAHPKLNPQENLAELSKSQIFFEILGDKKESRVVSNPYEGSKYFIVHQPVPDYGWGAYVAEPIKDVFMERDRNLWIFGMVEAILFLVLVFLLEPFRPKRNIKL